ncbi:MAG TPA: BON domain-containing protein [Thermoanaerobaculia bacterium]|nr:BON domain-containing protein [Thermoanaerobaculia bacterium]
MRKSERSRLLLLALVAFALIAGPAVARADDDAGAMLELKVRMTLLQKLGVDGMRVDVRAADGNVLLAGTVEKRETSELAETIVGSVEGVTHVDNRIRLSEYVETEEKAGVAATETERELRDAGLEARVRVALIDRLGRDGFRIGTDVAGRVVTLELPKDLGADRRREAVRVVKAVEGVEKVIELDKP